MSTPQERHAIADVLRGMADPILVELGAYGGEDSEWLRSACNSRYMVNVMVEPDTRNCEIIRKYRRGERTILIEAAIADYTGLVDFHRGVDERCDGGRSGSGSIRVPTGHLAAFPEIKFDPGRVPCWSLDHLMRSLQLPAIDLLWVDIQGAERDMIAGGAMTLAETNYIFIEAEQTELYDGQALRAELLAMLPDFKVVGEFDCNLLLAAH